MTATAPDVYYDPYDFEIDADPYPIWKRLRDEAPLYYNEKYDFYAVSRFDDVERCSIDWRTYLSGKGLGARDHQGRRRHPAGQHPLRGPAHARRAPLAALAGVHARGGSPSSSPRSGRSAPAASTRSSAPPASTSSPTSAPRCRCAPSACCSASPRQDQEAIRDRIDGGLPPRGGRTSRGGARPWRRAATHFAEYIEWRAAAPRRRHHDRAAHHRVRGPHGRAAHAHPRGDPRLHRPARRRRQRDDHAPHRVDGQAARRAPRSAPAARRGPQPGAQRDRGAAALRGALAGAGALHLPGRRAPRADDRGGQRDGAAHRGGQPRRAPLPGRRSVRHRARRSTTTSRSDTASTSASAPRSPASRVASRSTRCSTASPSGRSTGTTPSRPTPARCAVGSACRSSSPDQRPCRRTARLGDR